MLKRHLLRICFANDSFFEINFISDEDFVNLGLSVFVNRAHPILHIFERSLVSKIKANYYTLSLPVEVLSNCSEALLASSVPYFDVDSVSIAFILVKNKVQTYS